MSYGTPSREAVENAPVGGGADFWNPPEGDSHIRVMPPWAEDVEEFWFATGTHFNVGPDERAVPCPVMSGVAEACYMDRLVKRLAKGDDDEKAEAEAMGARPRYLLNIVDLEKPQNGVQVWPCPKTIFRQLKKFWLNEEDYGDFTSFTEGFDIIVEKIGSGINTKYDATPTRPKPFPSEKLLDSRNASVAELFRALADEEYELPNLAEVQSFLTDEEMERTYKGLSGGRSRTESKDDNGNNDDENEPEEEKPRRRSRREEPEEEPEEKPEEEPRRRRAREKPEEEPEEKPEEEPEEKPRSRKPKPSSGGGNSGSSRVRGRVKDLD
jgi:hypothetical protein